MTAIATTRKRSNNRRHLFAVHSATAAEPGPRKGADQSTADRPAPRWSALVIRMSVTDDAPQLRRLAHLDSARPLSGQALIAEQGGSIIAALSLDDGATIADPFVASADAVVMLRVRATQLTRSTAAA